MFMEEYEKQAVNRALFVLYCDLTKTEIMSPKVPMHLKPCAGQRNLQEQQI